MAQQPKKKNVAALSYSSLHEKLGQSNRLLKAAEADIARIREKCRSLDNIAKAIGADRDELRIKYENYKMLARCIMATSVILNIALLAFTIL